MLKMSSTSLCVLYQPLFKTWEQLCSAENFPMSSPVRLLIQKEEKKKFIYATTQTHTNDSSRQIK